MQMPSEQLWVLFVTLGHVLFGLLFLVAPQVVGSHYIKSSHLPFAPLDAACGFWFGVWLVWYGYLFYYGTRSEFVIQAFFLLAGVLCTFQALVGNATAFIPLMVLPCTLSFGVAGWSLHRDPLLRGISLPNLWSAKLSSIQNVLRLYAAVVLFGNGLGYLLFPRETNLLFVPNVPVSPIGLAFLSFNSAIQMGAAAIIISTENKMFLRNAFLLITALLIAVVVLHPLYAGPPMYAFITINLLGCFVLLQ